ncbi:MAG: hypothetical protein HOV80_06835 [Polyangiaceae bacterium]|nr:hypothetical protein [Polyangiaceae bacterium]
MASTGLAWPLRRRLAAACATLVVVGCANGTEPSDGGSTTSSGKGATTATAGGSNSPGTNANGTGGAGGDAAMGGGGMHAEGGSGPGGGGTGGADEGSWSPTTTLGAPTGRGDHTVIWSGSEVLVWGGRTSNGGGTLLDSGGRYDPSSDAWLTMSTTGAPSPRYAHTAVWTGTEMIVWGGWGTPGMLATGGIYTPSTNSWTALPTAGAPTLAEHAAVWTGSAMLVWGMDENANPVGARYAPGGGWSAISSVAAPAVRQYAPAVWTGAEMIIWGGTSLVDDGLDTGARYNPANDTWTPMSTDGAPAGRAFHSVVWTGSEMIVWGGRHEDCGACTELDDGGRYNPDTDTWSPLSAVGAPPPRRHHHAVWTGSEMILWSGIGDGIHLDDGGRYEPNDDSWVMLPTRGAPAPRSGPNAVWSGAEMVVWGGYGGGGLATGGRYVP